MAAEENQEDRESPDRQISSHCFRDASERRAPSSVRDVMNADEDHCADCQGKKEHRVLKKARPGSLGVNKESRAEANCANRHQCDQCCFLFIRYDWSVQHYGLPFTYLEASGCTGS